MLTICRRAGDSAAFLLFFAAETYISTGLVKTVHVVVSTDRRVQCWPQIWLYFLIRLLFSMYASLQGPDDLALCQAMNLQKDRPTLPAKLMGCVH